MNKKTNPLDLEKTDPKLDKADDTPKKADPNAKQIGAVFKEKRLEMGLNYLDIYNSLKIRSNVVDDIENSSWDYLEKHIHLANFAKQYAKFLKITDEEFIQRINGYTRVNHNIHEFSPIDTFKNTGKELNNLSDSGNNTFSMKKKSSNASKSIVISVTIIILIAIIGGIFAYKQGLFSSTKSLVKGYKTSTPSAQDKNIKPANNTSESEQDKAKNGFGKEKIKIIKLTTDDKTKTILEETPTDTPTTTDTPQDNTNQDTPTSENQPTPNTDTTTPDNNETALSELTQGNTNLTLIAMKDVWVYVKDKKTDTVLTGKILKKDEEFKIPTGDNLYLSVSSPYNVKGTFGDKAFQHLGKKNKVINLLKISENNLKTLFK